MVTEWRALVADLRRPNPRIYWVDLLLSTGATYVLIALGAVVRGAGERVALILLATLAMSRAFMFVHEITHFATGEMAGFRRAWNVLVGVPFLSPSVMYETVHRDHHRLHVYRTEGDPEHPPEAGSAWVRYAGLVAASVAGPALLALRWLVVGPLSWLHPRSRAFVIAHLSGLSLNFRYQPTPLSRRARRRLLASELACAAWLGLVIALLAHGWLPVGVVTVAAGAMVGTTLLTFLRGEILHAFNDEGSWGTLERQVKDSVNVPYTGLWSHLLLPVGIGYHALHHLDVSLPYHALPEAHARLLAALPRQSLYHRTTSEGIADAAWTKLGRDCVSSTDGRSRLRRVRALLCPSFQ